MFLPQLLLLLLLSEKMISPKFTDWSLHQTDNQRSFDVLTSLGKVRVTLALLEARRILK